MSDIDGPTVKINADAPGVDSAIQHVIQQFETLQTQAAGIGGKFEALGASMSSIGAGLTAGITAPMTVAVASIGAMTQQAANFQSQMAEVFTLMPGLGKEAMGQMSDDVKAFSSEFGIMSEQVVPALYQAISAGVPSDNVFSFLEVAAKSSIGGVTDLETAVDGLTTVMNSYTNDQVSAERAADAMFTAAKLGKTNFEELSQSMYQATPMANALGVSIEDVAAAFATLTAQGTPTNVSATQMKALFKELLDPASELSKYLDEVTEGADFKQLSDSGKSLFDVISILNNGLKEDGKQWTEVTGSIEASQAGMVLSSEMMGNFTNQMKDASGAVDEAYKTMSESAVQQMNKVKAELHNMVIDIGESFLPILQNDIMPILKDDLVPYIQNTVVPAIKGFADWFSSLDGEGKKAAAGVGIFAAALGPLLMVLGPIVSAGGSLLKTLATIGTLAKTTTAVGGVSTLVTSLNQLSKITPIPIAQYTAPIGPAMAGATTAVAGLSTALLGIGAAAGIGLALYATNLGDFRTNVDEILKSVTDAISHFSSGEYSQAGRDMANAVAGGFETVSDLITKGIPDASRIFYEFNVGLMDATTDMTRGLGQATGGFIRELSSDISKAISDLQSSPPELVIPTKIDPPNKAEYEANMKEFLDGTKSVIDNYDLSDSSTRFVTKAAVNSVTMGMGGNSIELVHQIGTFFKGIYEEGIIHAVDEFIAANPRMGLDKVEEHFKNSMNASDSNVASEYIGKMKTEMQTAFQGLEKEIETPLRNAGVSVKKFATQSAADIHNAMEKWQKSFKESKLSYEDWMDSLKKSGQFDEYIADMQKYAETFPEITKEAGSAAQVIQGLDFMPVEFKAGNSIYANYKNNVLTPIVSEPIQIMLENATESEFNYILTHYNEIKNQIENSPINITYVGPAGDPEPNWGVTPHYTPDIQPNPNNATLNVNVVSMPQSFTDKYKDFDKESQLKMWNALTPDAQSKFGGSTQSTPDNKTVNQNTDAQNKNTESNTKNTEQVSALYKKFSDWDTYQSQYMLQNKGASVDTALAAYNNDKRIASQSSSGSQPSQSDNTKATSDNTTATRKSTEAKTDEQKASEAYNKKIQDAIHQMGKWDIQDKYDKKNIESNKPNMMEYDSIEAYNKALSAYSDKIDTLTDSRAEKEELLAYDLGITVDELRNLAAGNKNVTSSGEKVVSTFNTIANIDFSKLTNPFAPQQTGTGTPLNDAELTSILRSKMPYASDSDFAGIVAQQGGIKALAKSWGIIDESGRRIGEYTSETTDKLERSSELLKSVSDIIGDDLSPGFDRATKYIEEFKKITGDDTDYSDGNQKTLALLLNAYKDASDLQDKYEDVLSDSNYSLDEQRDITDKYNDILRLVGLTGIDTTQSLEGLPPAIRAIVEAIMALVNGVKVNSDTRTGGLETPDKKPNKSYIGEIDAASDQLFKKIQQDFKNVQSAYDSGKLSQADYLKQLKELSVEADILSHDPGALKGAQREAIQRFEETIQEQFRRDYAGTGAKGIKNYNPDSSLKSAITDLNSQSYPIGKSIKETGTEAKTTTPQINTLNSAFEKIGLTGTGLSDVLSNVDQALSDHRASILESEDYLSKYNQAAGENTKYTQDQERQTYSLMNSLGMLGTAQDMYNNYMSDGVLDATEAASVQQALAAATKMMGDAGITAEGGISGLPGALQALAGAAQSAMAAIQAAISQAQSAVAQYQPMQGSQTSQMSDSPHNQSININMNNNTFPTGTNPGEVFSTFVNGTRVIGV